MKHFLNFSAAIFIAFLLAACNKEELIPEVDNDSTFSVKSSSEGIDYSKYANLLSDTVSLKDAVIYAQMIASETNREAKKITPYVENGDTLAYFIPEFNLTVQQHHQV